MGKTLAQQEVERLKALAAQYPGAAVGWLSMANAKGKRTPGGATAKQDAQARRAPLKEGQYAVNSEHFKPALRAAVSRAEAQLARVGGYGEHIHLITRGGREIAVIRSKHNKELEIPGELGVKVRGGVLTHNHPGLVSFSDTDLEAAMILGPQALRAVVSQPGAGGRYMTYELRANMEPGNSPRPGQRGWSHGWWETKGNAIYRAEYARAFARAYDDLRAGKLKNTKAAQFQAQTEAVRGFVRATGDRFLYTETVHDGTGLQPGDGHPPVPTPRTGGTSGRRGGGGNGQGAPRSRPAGGTRQDAGQELLSTAKRHYRTALNITQKLSGL